MSEEFLGIDHILKFLEKVSSVAAEAVDKLNKEDKDEFSTALIIVYLFKGLTNRAIKMQKIMEKHNGFYPFFLEMLPLIEASYKESESLEPTVKH